MKPGTRACIAYIAGTINGNNRSSSVYDYTRSKHVSISGTVDEKKVNIFDYDRSCHLQGSLNNLYDYGNSAHITFQISGRNFKGYDYDTSSHYSGTVNGNSISIYDYSESSHFSYSV